MRTPGSKRCSMLALALMAATLVTTLVAQPPAANRTTYFPAAGGWQHKMPAEVGMDAGKLKEAVDWAESHGSKWDFQKDQVRTFGKVLGALPAGRAATNGIILRHGYIVAEFGDTKTNDPVYSVAKSFLSTTASIAVAKGLIRSVDDPVAAYMHDGGYDSPHNAKISATLSEPSVAGNLSSYPAFRLYGGCGTISHGPSENSVHGAKDWGGGCRRRLCRGWHFALHQARPLLKNHATLHPVASGDGGRQRRF